MDGPTDGRTDGRTKPLIELRVRNKKEIKNGKKKRKKKIGKEKKGNRKKDLWIRRSEGIKLLRCWRADRKNKCYIGNNGDGKISREQVSL